MHSNRQWIGFSYMEPPTVYGNIKKKITIF